MFLSLLEYMQNNAILFFFHFDPVVHKRVETVTTIAKTKWKMDQLVLENCCKRGGVVKFNRAGDGISFQFEIICGGSNTMAQLLHYKIVDPNTSDP